MEKATLTVLTVLIFIALVFLFEGLRVYGREVLKRFLIWLLLLIAVLVAPAILIKKAHGHGLHRHHHHRWQRVARDGDPRPHAWCGWFMRHQLGVADRNGNRARWWAGYGSPASGPAVGVLVVWPHHVGRITGQSSRGWIVLSGNDGHAVRERPRSLRGVIAFRWP